MRSKSKFASFRTIAAPLGGAILGGVLACVGVCGLLGITLAASIPLFLTTTIFFGIGCALIILGATSFLSNRFAVNDKIHQEIADTLSYKNPTKKDKKSEKIKKANIKKIRRSGAQPIFNLQTPKKKAAEPKAPQSKASPDSLETLRAENQRLTQAIEMLSAGQKALEVRCNLLTDDLARLRNEKSALPIIKFPFETKDLLELFTHQTDSQADFDSFKEQLIKTIQSLFTHTTINHLSSYHEVSLVEQLHILHLILTALHFAITELTEIAIETTNEKVGMILVNQYNEDFLQKLKTQDMDIEQIFVAIKAYQYAVSTCLSDKGLSTLSSSSSQPLYELMPVPENLSDKIKQLVEDGRSKSNIICQNILNYLTGISHQLNVFIWLKKNNQWLAPIAVMAGNDKQLLLTAKKPNSNKIKKKQQHAHIYNNVINLLTETKGIDTKEPVKLFADFLQAQLSYLRRRINNLADGVVYSRSHKLFGQAKTYADYLSMGLPLIGGVLSGIFSTIDSISAQREKNSYKRISECLSSTLRKKAFSKVVDLLTQVLADDIRSMYYQGEIPLNTYKIMNGYHEFNKFVYGASQDTALSQFGIFIAAKIANFFATFSDTDAKLAWTDQELVKVLIEYLIVPYTEISVIERIKKYLSFQDQVILTKDDNHQILIFDELLQKHKNTLMLLAENKNHFQLGIFATPRCREDDFLGQKCTRTPVSIRNPIHALSPKGELRTPKPYFIRRESHTVRGFGKSSPFRG